MTVNLPQTRQDPGGARRCRVWSLRVTANRHNLSQKNCPANCRWVCPWGEAKSAGLASQGKVARTAQHAVV